MPRKPLVPELPVTIKTSPGLGIEPTLLVFSNMDEEWLSPSILGVAEIACLKKYCGGVF